MTITQQTPQKQGVRARERNALERIASLEQDFGRLVQGMQAAVNETDQKIGTISEIVDAIVNLFGPDTVQDSIKVSRQKRAYDQAKQAKEGLDIALVEGKVEKLEKVEEGCIITGVEKDKDGKVLPPEYVQVNLGDVKVQFKEKLLGQCAGFSFETEPGGTFELTGVYRPVPQAPIQETDGSGGKA